MTPSYLAESKEELLQLVTSVTQKRAQAGLYVNLKKIMSSGDLEEIVLDGEQVEIVRDFVFLGAKIEDSGSCKGEIWRRLALGRAAMTAKKQRRRIDSFELWCWRRLVQIPWTARRTNTSVRSINKEATSVIIRTYHAKGN